MKRTLALCALTLMTAPLALADQWTLGVPDFTCQSPPEWRLHDYNTDPPQTGVYASPATLDADTQSHLAGAGHRPSKYMFPYLDGNLGECGNTYGLFLLSDEDCQFLADNGFGPGNPIFDVGCSTDQPADWDGDREFGFLARALLVSTSGDGVTSGGFACWDTIGHHPQGGTVTVTDARGLPVAFTINADFTDPSDPADPLNGPDCGDGTVQPCDPNPPGPYPLPQPVGGVVDTVNALLYSLFNSDGITCTSGDVSKACLDSCAADFAPGIDGAYHVQVSATLAGNNGEPTVATQGHVYL